jgi:hypothetical protein
MSNRHRAAKKLVLDYISPSCLPAGCFLLLSQPSRLIPHCCALARTARALATTGASAITVPIDQAPCPAAAAFSAAITTSVARSILNWDGEKERKTEFT